MSSGSEQHSKYTVYSFSDNKEKFQEWKIKTLSLARVHKVHRYLTKEIEIPDKAAAELQGEGSKEQKTYDGNVKAYDILVRSCTSTPLSIVNYVQDDNAYQAWVKLLKTYETDEGDIQELEGRWTNCKLEDFRTDPDTWFL